MSWIATGPKRPRRCFQLLVEARFRRETRDLLHHSTDYRERSAAILERQLEGKQVHLRTEFGAHDDIVAAATTTSGLEKSDCEGHRTTRPPRCTLTMTPGISAPAIGNALLHQGHPVRRSYATLTSTSATIDHIDSRWSPKASGREGLDFVCGYPAQNQRVAIASLLLHRFPYFSQPYLIPPLINSNTSVRQTMAHEAQPIHLSAKTGSAHWIAVNVDFLSVPVDHILQACNDAQLFCNARCQRTF